MIPKWVVYKHTAPDGRAYIGVAQEPKVRWANGKGYKDNSLFWECIQRVGWENITHEILYEGLTSREGRRKESELIDLYGTLTPNGFNRCVDHPGLNKGKKKVEVGRRIGFTNVVDYWPDKERMKVYLLRCDCGKEFICKWENLTDDLNCGCKAK